MKNKKVWFTAFVLALLGSAVQAQIIIQTQPEPTGGPYTSVSSDNRIESQSVNTNYRATSLKYRHANANRVIIPFFRFDISSLSGLDLSGTTFSHTITWESNNSNVTLDVWGLIDGVEDYWDSSTLTWTTAAGTLGWLTWTTDGSGTYTNYTVNTAKWQKLGTVAVAVTAGSPNLTVTSNMTDCNLDSFLNADTNGLVTLALVSGVNNHWCNIGASDDTNAAYRPALTIPVGPTNPQPANGSTVINYNALTQLNWDSQGIVRYDVWFGADDANELDYRTALTKIATIDNPGTSVSAAIPAGMLPLTAPQTYTWALDGFVYKASDPNHTGEPNQLVTTNVWQFATTSVPSVSADPADQYVFLTESASFTAVFAALTPVLDVTWYKDGIALGSDPDIQTSLTNGSGNLYTATLTVNNAELANDGAYTCIARNTGGYSGATAPAYLVIKRMLAHWAFDGDAADETGVYSGTLVGSPVFEPAGKAGQALIFDGADDYVDLPDGFANLRSGMSLAVWAYPTAVNNWARFIDFGNLEGADDIFVGRNQSTNTLRLDFAPWPGAADATDALALNTWQMFVVTMSESGEVIFYKDGFPLVTRTVTAMPTVVTRTNNFIGKSNWATDALYAGMMDDMRIFNYAITADHVADLYSAVAGPYCRTQQTYDFSGNCIVDLADLMMVASEWLNCGMYPNPVCQ